VAVAWPAGRNNIQKQHPATTRDLVADLLPLVVEAAA
jgi:hypothetical protein